jgi:hypothetical protein
MHSFSRFLATISVAAVAVTGQAAFGASSVSAAEPAAGHAVSAASGPIECSPGQLRGKANRHTQKAAEYQILLARELVKENPDKQKIAHYEKMVKAHKKKADEYHAKADRCLDADKRQ